MADTQPAGGAAEDAFGSAAVWAVFLVALAAKATLAALLPLGFDESYAIAVARGYDLSFFDHPPLGFWAPVASADLLGTESPFVFRLPALAFGAVTFWSLAWLGARLGGPQTALLTVLLFSFAPVMVANFGILAMPDAPLGAFSALAAVAAVRLADAARPAPWLWLFAGLVMAAALASKYQAALFALAVLAFAVLVPDGRRWWRHPGFWIALLIGAAGTLPVLLWNAAHDWASLSFHGGRTAPGLEVGNWLRMALIQLLMLSPPILVLAVLGLGTALGRDADPAARLLAFFAIGPVVVFNLVYFVTPLGFAHWTMPGWLFALPLAAHWLAERGGHLGRGLWRGAVAFTVLVWCLVPVLALHVRTGVLTAGQTPPPAYDDTRGLYGYPGLETALAAHADLASLDLVLVPEWMEAGQIATALGGRYPVRPVTGNPHHFRFLPVWSRGGEALLVSGDLLFNAGRHRDRILDLARQIDPGAVALPPVTLDRGGRPYLSITAVRLRVGPADP